MTDKDLEMLCKEVKEVLFDKTLTINNMSESQKVFSAAFESGEFGTTLLRTYSDLVEKMPGITIKNLHSFCIGFALGERNKEEADKLNINTTKTFH